MTTTKAVQVSQKAKREWHPWYHMRVPPLCPSCEVPCIVKRTRTTPDGRRIQHRYCPQCGQSQKTSYEIKREAEIVDIEKAKPSEN